MSYGTNGTKFSGPNRRKLFPVSAALALRNLGRRDYAAVVAQALRNVTAGLASATKIVAQAANANEKSAENWMGARTLPNAYYLDCLREAFPELDAEIRRLRGSEAEGEPIERQIAMLINQAVRLRATHESLARENRGADAEASRESGAAPRRESGEVAAAARTVVKP